MSETILKILLAELTTVRLRCKRPQCGAVVEIPTSELAKVTMGGACPVCHAQLVAAGSRAAEAFRHLVDGIQGLTANPEAFEIEFVIAKGVNEGAHGGAR